MAAEETPVNLLPFSSSSSSFVSFISLFLINRLKIARALPLLACVLPRQKLVLLLPNQFVLLRGNMNGTKNGWTSALLAL